MGTDREGVQPGIGLKEQLDGFVETGNWGDLVGTLTDLEKLMLIVRDLPRTYGPGAATKRMLSSYLEKIPEEIKSGDVRLSHMSANLPSFSESVALYTNVGCGEADPKATCKECGAEGIIHGHVDLGGVDFYDNYFALCPGCFWSWHTEDNSESQFSSPPIRDFRYDTNTY